MSDRTGRLAEDAMDRAARGERILWRCRSEAQADAAWDAMIQMAEFSPFTDDLDEARPADAVLRHPSGGSVTVRLMGAPVEGRRDE